MQLTPARRANRRAVRDTKYGGRFLELQDYVGLRLQATDVGARVVTRQRIHTSEPRRSMWGQLMFRLKAFGGTGKPNPQ
jgi:hypothetical protein